MTAKPASRIAACLIVKNEEASLERCLASIRPFVDEINVYDTGSTDDTFELLAQLERQSEVEVNGRTVPAAPITVRRGEWRNDFAWAREQSFAMASDEIGWHLLVDADEEITGARELRRLTAEAPPDVDGFVFFWDVERDEAGNITTQAWRERLIRREAGYRWQGAAHAVLAPPLGRAANLLRVPKEVVRFIHHGEPGRWHPSRALEILSVEVEREGIAAANRSIFYLACEYMWRGAFDDAARYFAEYLDRHESDDSVQRAVAAHKLATCLRASGRPQAAIEVELKSYAQREDWPEIALGLAESYAALGRWAEVETWAARALALGVPDSPLLHAPLKLRLMPHLRLAEAALARGRAEEAIAAFRSAIDAAAPTAYLSRRYERFEAALAAADHAAARPHLREAIARYDDALQAFARGLWLAADPSLDRSDARAGPSA